MFHIGLLICLYVLAVFAAGIIGLLILHAGYLRAVIHQWPCIPEVRYAQFMRLHLSRKRAILVLVKLPLIVAIALILFILGTRTTEVRSNITASTRLVVRTGGNCHRDPNREKRLYETEDPDSIRKFADQISLKLDLYAGECACCGEMTFDMYTGDDLRYSFSLQHGERIRIKGSSFGDRRLTSRSRRDLARWLSERGIREGPAQMEVQRINP